MKEIILHVDKERMEELSKKMKKNRKRRRQKSQASLSTSEEEEESQSSLEGNSKNKNHKQQKQQCPIMTGTDSKDRLNEWRRELQQELLQLQSKIEKYILLHDDELNDDKEDTNETDYDDGGKKEKEKSRVDFMDNINHIPGMVNRILNELSSGDEGSKPRLLSTFQAKKPCGRESNVGVQNIGSMASVVMQLLLSLTIGFGQCYLHNLGIQKMTKNENLNANDQLQNNNAMNNSLRYDTSAAERRLYEWISDTIFQILHSLDNTTHHLNNHTRIPSLDALLATTGYHNGVSHDLILQNLWSQVHGYGYNSTSRGDRSCHYEQKRHVLQMDSLLQGGTTYAKLNHIRKINTADRKNYHQQNNVPNTTTTTTTTSAMGPRQFCSSLSHILNDTDGDNGGDGSTDQSLNTSNNQHTKCNDISSISFSDKNLFLLQIKSFMNDF